MENTRDLIVKRNKKTMEIDTHTFNKMLFIYNAVQSGWEVKTHSNKYIFTKKHEGRKEVYRKDYLENFVASNFEISER